MKTTLEISDDLLRRAKRAALERNTTLRAIVEEALARALGPAVAQVTALRTLTWPPPDALDGKKIGADAVLAAIARERSAPGDDPACVERRLGLARPPRKGKKR